jgi:hypothetical protein
MQMQKSVLAVGVVALLSGGTAQAQPAAPRGPQDPRAVQISRQVRESRYQLGQMERVLEGAVEHGATVIRDRMQGLMPPGLPADMLLTDDARARGFRLDGYGVFFDVEVPSLQGTLPWSFRTLDQNSLNLASALQTMRMFVEASGNNNADLQQALKRIELQVAPMAPAEVTTVPVASRGAASSGPVTANATAVSTAAADPILTDPNEEYRSQIRDALIDAMLEHSRGLNIGANEVLTVAARRSDDRPRLAPVDTDAGTVVISVRGADLVAFLGGQITRDEARQRVEVRVF